MQTNSRMIDCEDGTYVKIDHALFAIQVAGDYYYWHELSYKSYTQNDLDSVYQMIKGAESIVDSGL